MAQEIIAERYQVISTLGSGGMGVVYRALDLMLKKEVAVKTLRASTISGDQVLRFQTEAVALSNLKHPNIVDIMVCGLTQDNVPYMVMTFVEGKSLASLIQSRGYIPAYKSVNIFIALADGLAHAHRNGVIHRDLKPANIVMVDPDSLHARPIVVDFGIAQLEHSQQSITRPGTIIGTPIYMSPEQLKGKQIDARSDIYSFGCVMYETLTGKRPFEGDNDLEIMERKLTHDAPTLSNANLDLAFPKALEMIVAKALAVDPDLRFQSMEELKEALVLLKQGELQPEAHPQSTSSATIPKPKTPKAAKHIVLAVMVAVLIAAATITALYFGILGGKKGSHMAAITSDYRMNEMEQKSDKLLDPLFKETIKPKVTALKRPDGTIWLTISTQMLLAISDDELLELIKQHKEKIAVISISNCEIKGTCFKQLQDQPIRDVALNGTSLTKEGLAGVCALKTLRGLKLDNHYNLTKEALEQIAVHKDDLEQFMVPRCDLTDQHFSNFPKFKSLIYLDTSKNQRLTGAALKFVAYCPKLEGLNISHDKLISIEDLATLKHLRELTVLFLNHCNLEDKDIKRLVELFPQTQKLHVFSNQKLTSTALKHAAKLKKLVLLTISAGPDLTPKHIAEFKKQLPKCQVVLDESSDGGD